MRWVYRVFRVLDRTVSIDVRLERDVSNSYACAAVTGPRAEVEDPTDIG